MTELFLLFVLKLSISVITACLYCAETFLLEQLFYYVTFICDRDAESNHMSAEVILKYGPGQLQSKRYA